MTLNEVMTLVNAGFSKAEIMAMSGEVQELKQSNEALNTDSSEPTEAIPITEGDITGVDSAEVIDANSVSSGTEEAKAREVVKETIVEKLPTNVNFAPLMTDAQVEMLAQKLNLGSATIDLPQTAMDYEQKLSNHFESILKGDY